MPKGPSGKVKLASKKGASKGNDSGKEVSLLQGPHPGMLNSGNTVPFLIALDHCVYPCQNKAPAPKKAAAPTATKKVSVSLAFIYILLLRLIELRHPKLTP